jgi:hypothetical protein
MKKQSFKLFQIIHKHGNWWKTLWNCKNIKIKVLLYRLFDPIVTYCKVYEVIEVVEEEKRRRHCQKNISQVLYTILNFRLTIWIGINLKFWRSLDSQANLPETNPFFMCPNVLSSSFSVSIVLGMYNFESIVKEISCLGERNVIFHWLSGK